MRRYTSRQRSSVVSQQRLRPRRLTAPSNVYLNLGLNLYHILSFLFLLCLWKRSARIEQMAASENRCKLIAESRLRYRNGFSPSQDFYQSDIWKWKCLCVCVEVLQSWHMYVVFTMHANMWLEREGWTDAVAKHVLPNSGEHALQKAWKVIYNRSFKVLGWDIPFAVRREGYRCQVCVCGIIPAFINLQSKQGSNFWISWSTIQNGLILR